MLDSIPPVCENQEDTTILTQPWMLILVNTIIASPGASVDWKNNLFPFLLVSNAVKCKPIYYNGITARGKNSTSGVRGKRSNKATCKVILLVYEREWEPCHSPLEFSISHYSRNKNTHQAKDHLRQLRIRDPIAANNSLNKSLEWIVLCQLQSLSIISTQLPTSPHSNTFMNGWLCGSNKYKIKNPGRAFLALEFHDWKLSLVLELSYKEEQLGAVQDPSSGKFLQQLWEEDMTGLSHTHWGLHKPKMECTPYLALPTTRFCNLSCNKY